MYRTVRLDCEYDPAKTTLEEARKSAVESFLAEARSNASFNGEQEGVSINDVVDFGENKTNPSDETRPNPADATPQEKTLKKYRVWKFVLGCDPKLTAEMEIIDAYSAKEAEEMVGDPYKGWGIIGSEEITEENMDWNNDFLRLFKNNN